MMGGRVRVSNHFKPKFLHLHSKQSQDFFVIFLLRSIGLDKSIIHKLLT